MPSFFFFNDTATTEIYTLSLHDALPILTIAPAPSWRIGSATALAQSQVPLTFTSKIRSHDSSSMLSRSDRKSTRLNSSHANISYAVFCLKKKQQILAQLSFRTTDFFIHS